MIKFKIRHIVFFLFLLLNTSLLNAQERGLLLTQYYSSTDYDAPSQNWSIKQDNRGVMYFGNTNCILEYDGNEWRKIYVPNNSTIRTIDIDKNNTIYVGAFEELGFLLPDKNGTLNYHSLNYLIDSAHATFGDVWAIDCIENEVFFLTDNYLFRYKNKKFDYWNKEEDRFYLSHKVDNNLYVQEIGNGLLKFENNSLNLIDKGKFFSDKRIHSILSYEDKLLLCTRTEGLFVYDNSVDPVQIKPISSISTKGEFLNNYLIKNVFYHGIKISDTLFAMSTINGGVLLVDDQWNIIDVIDHKSTGITSPAQYLYYQKDQSLWMALAEGICKVDILSPFRYWNDTQGINGAISDVASLDDNLYVSTVSGIYYTPRKRDCLNYSINNFIPLKEHLEQVWSFLYFILPNTDFKTTENLLYTKENRYSPGSDKLLLLAASSTGLFQINKGKAIKIADYKAIFDIHQSRKDPSIIFLGLSNGIAQMSYKKGKWTDLGMKFHITDQIRELTEDTLGNLWASATYKGIYQIQSPLRSNKQNIVNFFNEESGLPSVNSVRFFQIDHELLFKSGNNYMIFDNASDHFVEYEESPFDEESYSEESLDTLPWYKVYETLNSNTYVTTKSDSSIWFSTTKGTFRYVYSNRKDYFNIPPVIIRKVLSEDSIIYNGTNYTNLTNNLDSCDIQLSINPNPIIDIGTILDFKNNSLTFSYSLPYYEEESKNEYSFMLDGYDKSWSPWSLETKKEYTNLSEGEFVFRVKSRNLYTLESPISEFKFCILPPWYRSLWAILGYIVLGIILIILIVRLYTYRLIKEKDKLEKVVIERTQEILMQKEEILVQAEHLKDANERITTKNHELEKQKWEITNQALKLKKANVELIKLSKVASETDNAIAIFDKDGNIEWVNEGFTRMYGYTTEQYTKEKNGNIIDGSDNPNIQEAVKSCITDKKSVVYEFKTKTRTGEELWAQTTLTNVIDKKGETINLIAIDSDITKIKLAEKEILKQKHEIEEQRDKLEISNATKNKFFRIIAHDLRNPISTLAGSTNLIFNDFEDYNKEQTKMFIGELNKLSQTTFNLLENLLDWSSTQMGQIKFSPTIINLYSLTIENIELIKRKVDSKNIQLTLNITKDCNVFADENMIKTVIRNLLSNAVKFTPEKGVVKISCIIMDQFVKYSVRDSGIGIQSEDQKKLFRIDTHHTTLGLSNEKGSGLGLILCKEFIEKNRGVIKISSQPDKGTFIEFTLQRNPF